MSSATFLCAAFIWAACALTLGQVQSNNLPPSSANSNANAASGTTSTQAPPTTTLPPVAKLSTTVTPGNNGSSSNDQCACGGQTGGRCTTYSKKWQANTIDEAIEFFRSPLDVDQSKPTAMTNDEKNRVKNFFKQSDKSNESKEKDEPLDVCEKDEKCQICMSGVYYYLAIKAGVSGISTSAWTTLLYSNAIKKLERDSGIPFVLVRDTCKQSPYQVMTVQAINTAYYEVLRVLSCKSCMQQYATLMTTFSDDSHRIAKRQSTVGTTIQVRCDYRRGQLVGDGTNYVGMCNLCWSVRQLPAQYSPRFLNEVTCSSDTMCLAGYGLCRARFRATNVMYNNQYEVSVNAQSGCECQIVSGSAFFSYVNA